jgi:hypothetical protein
MTEHSLSSTCTLSIFKEQEGSSASNSNPNRLGSGFFGVKKTACIIAWRISFDTTTATRKSLGTSIDYRDRSILCQEFI